MSLSATIFTNNKKHGIVFVLAIIFNELKNMIFPVYSRTGLLCDPSESLQNLTAGPSCGAVVSARVELWFSHGNMGLNPACITFLSLYPIKRQ